MLYNNPEIYTESYVVTGNNSANLARVASGFLIFTTAGNVKVTFEGQDDDDAVTFAVAKDVIYRGLRIKKIFQTGTTAVGILVFN